MDRVIGLRQVRETELRRTALENLQEQLSSLISEHGLWNVLTSISNVCDNIAHDLTHDEKEPDEELASEYRAAARKINALSVPSYL